METGSKYFLANPMHDNHFVWHCSQGLDANASCWKATLRSNKGPWDLFKVHHWLLTDCKYAYHFFTINPSFNEGWFSFEKPNWQILWHQNAFLCIIIHLEEGCIQAPQTTAHSTLAHCKRNCHGLFFFKPLVSHSQMDLKRPSKHCSHKS